MTVAEQHPNDRVQETTALYDTTRFASLQAYADHLNDQLTGKSATEIIQWTYEAFGERTALSSSFGIQSAVMLHLIQSVHPQMPVIWIDTGYLPAETYRFVAQLTKELQLNVKVYQSLFSPARMEALYGRLWEQRSEEAHRQYGFLRKVEPMQRALRELNVHALLVGVRADQTTHRSKNMRVVNVYEGRLKICPILPWSKQQVHEYMALHELPYHPLKALGYESVGDAHSSRPLTAEDGADDRAGRFHGVSQECGLHIDINMRLEDLAMVDEAKTHSPTAGEVSLRTKAYSTEHIVVFTKPSCKYCIATKELMRERGMAFEDFTVGKDLSIDALQRIVGSPVKTVPQIFLQGKYIGGYTDLCAHLEIPSRFA